MDVVINVLKDILIKPCPYCYGSGKLKAMQSVVTFNGVSIRGKDVTVKCEYCNGSGLIK